MFTETERLMQIIAENEHDERVNYSMFRHFFYYAAAAFSIGILCALSVS